MKRLLALALALLVASGCLPSRNGVPFGDEGSDAANNGNNGTDAANNGTPDAANNGTPDAANNGTPDAANNGTPDAANNGIPDAANNGTPDATMDVCVPETDEEFCMRESAECDMLTAPDNCGMQRTADCGMCAGGEICANNICGMCNAENDQQFCSRQGAECGQLTALDNCRMQRTVNCGGCPGTGTGCNLQNTCQEANCRDGLDNDGANGADCADPACLGIQCTGNPNKVCQANGTCN